jgi:hypothetical protein
MVIGASQSTNEVKVLFIGNSVTYYHDLLSFELANAGTQRPMSYRRGSPDRR